MGVFLGLNKLLCWFVVTAGAGPFLMESVLPDFADLAGLLEGSGLGLGELRSELAFFRML